MPAWTTQISVDAWATIATAIFTGILALLTWWLASSTIREGRRSTGLQLFSQMVDSYQAEPMRQLRIRLAKSLLDDIRLDEDNEGTPWEREAKEEFGLKFGKVDLTIWEFFENMGRLVRAEALDPQITWNYFSDAVMAYWEASKEVIGTERKRTKEDDLFTDFEWLADDFATRDSRGRRLKPARTLSQQRVKELLESESRLLSTTPVSISV